MGETRRATVFFVCARRGILSLFFCMWLLLAQRMVIEFALDVLYFPLWWFTGGAKDAFKFCVHLFRLGNAQFAPGLWLKNIFVPMFGQNDWQGRLVSFFVRLGNVIFRSMILLVWLVVVVILYALWFAFPIFVTWMLLTSLV